MERKSRTFAGIADAMANQWNFKIKKHKMGNTNYNVVTEEVEELLNQWLPRKAM